MLQEAEREELRNSLVLTQESAAIQILLETCQATGEEEEEVSSRLTDLQETQSAVCCYLHQAFIEDTTMTLAKLVHFQVKHILSLMHIHLILPSPIILLTKVRNDEMTLG